MIWAWRRGRLLDPAVYKKQRARVVRRGYAARADAI